jgi:hypothetical protein
MMNGPEKDILQDIRLKDSPYKVPEGYFEAFKQKASGYSRPVVVPFKERRKIFVTLISRAAIVIALITGGVAWSFWDRKPAEAYSQEDFLVFSSNITDDILYDSYAEADMLEDDIIEYLIYSGESAETIESYLEYLSL